MHTFAAVLCRLHSEPVIIPCIRIWHDRLGPQYYSGILEMEQVIMLIASLAAFAVLAVSWVVLPSSQAR